MNLTTLPKRAFPVLIRDHPRKSAVSLGFPITAISAMTRDHGDPPSVVWFFVEKKIFWLLFTVLGVVMGVLLPSLWWNVALTLPLLVLCWWVVYRSGWFS